MEGNVLLYSVTDVLIIFSGKDVPAYYIAGTIALSFINISFSSSEGLKTD